MHWLPGPVWEDASLSKATWKEIQTACQEMWFSAFVCWNLSNFGSNGNREVGLLTPGPPWQFLSALPNSRAPQRLFDSVRRFATPWRVLPGRREVRCGYGAAEQLGFWRSLSFHRALEGWPMGAVKPQSLKTSPFLFPLKAFQHPTTHCYAHPPWRRWWRVGLCLDTTTRSTEAVEVSISLTEEMEDRKKHTHLRASHCISETLRKKIGKNPLFPLFRNGFCRWLCTLARRLQSGKGTVALHVFTEAGRSRGSLRRQGLPGAQKSMKNIMKSKKSLVKFQIFDSTTKQIRSDQNVWSFCLKGLRNHHTVFP